MSKETDDAAHAWHTLQTTAIVLWVYIHVASDPDEKDFADALWRFLRDCDLEYLIDFSCLAKAPPAYGTDDFDEMAQWFRGRMSGSNADKP